MGQFLFWLEAAVTSVLFAALGLAIVSRIQRRGRRWVVRIVWSMLAILPWLVAIGAFAAVGIWAGGALVPLMLSAIGGIATLLATIAVVTRGRKISPGTNKTIAETWRLSRLALAWVGALLLTCMTFWNLDLAVRQEMAAIRVEAGAVALSVAPPRVPDSQNAAVLYRQAWEALAARNDGPEKWDRAVAEWLHPREGKFRPADERMRAFLERSQAAIELLRKAAERPACNFGTQYNPPSVAVVLPSLSKMRDLSRLLCLSSRAAASKGRMDDAMDDLHAAWVLAEHCTAEPALIASLVAFAAEAQAFDTCQYVLDHGTLNHESLDASVGAVPVSYQDALHRSMRMETAFGMCMFTMADPAMAFPAEHAPGVADAVIGAAAPYRAFLWNADVAAYLRWMHRYEQLSSEPYFKSVSEWQSPRQKAGREGVGGLLASIIAPSFSRSAELAAIADAQRRLVTVSIAMWRYRLAEGSFPSELGQLVPHYVFKVPTDPFTGESMNMARTDDGIVIYSVGPDMNDDGGKPLDRRTLKGDVSLRLRG